MTAHPTPSDMHAQLQGQRYTATPTHHNTRTCAGCAASSPQLMASEQNTLCQALPPCFASGRADGRNVIWTRQGAHP